MDIFSEVLKTLAGFEQENIDVNFTSLPSKRCSRSITFVDGGNLEIISSPSLSVYFNKVYFTTYRNNTRIRNRLFEFYTLIRTFHEDKLGYEATTYFTRDGLDMERYTFDPHDPSLAKNGKTAPISLIGQVIRRLAELKATNLADSDFVVIDGSLEAEYPYEEALLDSPRLFGLSKTNEMLTSRGDTYVSALVRNAKAGNWICQIDERTYFVKLNKNSDYVFRLDMKKRDDDLLSLLVHNSKDPVFLGYPYGLVEADRFARVSLRQSERLKLKFMVKLGKDYEKIRPYISSLDAHDILDSIG